MPSATGGMAPPGPGALAPPDPYQNEQKILDLITRRMQKWEKGRENIIISAHRNILFYRGHQWIIYNRALGRFAPRDLKPGTPRPVTNRFASCIAAYMAVLARVEPVLNFRPATDDPDDRATADVAAKVMPAIEDEINIRLVRQHLAAWVALTPGAWLEFGYDNDPAHGMTVVQSDQCLNCGNLQGPGQSTCEECGSGLLMPAQNDQGAPVGDEAPIGKMYAEVVPCFEMYFDPAVADWTKVTEYARKKAVDLDDCKQRWPQFADQLQPDMGGTLSELYEANLPTLGPNLGDQRRNVYNTPYGMHQMPHQRISETWFWQAPTADFPDGLLAVRLGRSLLAKAGPLPYYALAASGKKEPLLPHVHFPEQIVPGTAWSKTPADDLALLQEKRNQLESIVLMIMMRMGNPVWFLPEGSNVTGFTGYPGEIIRYNALGPNPAKPERVPGQGLPSGFLALIDKCDQDMEDAASTYEVLKGNRPPGVSAAVAIQAVQERAMSRFGSQFILWEQAWAHAGRLLLQLFRQFVTEPRLTKIQGKDGAWQIQKFLGADLSGQVDVQPEAGSGMPRSTLVDRAEMQDLVQQGIINPQDPDTNYKILQVYQRTDLVPAMKLDSKNAIMEDEQFAQLAANPQAVQLVALAFQQTDQQAQQIGQPVPYAQTLALLAQSLQQAGLQTLKLPRVRQAVDNHMVHAREHANTAKGEDQQAWPPPIQRLQEGHLAEHQQIMQQQQMAQMQQQRAQPYTQAPSAQPPGSGNPSQGQHANEPGGGENA
jgi:hypothetical protein